MTEKEIAKKREKDLIFDAEKVRLIKRTIAKDATDDELELFLYQARRTGLDPLANQIYFQKYKERIAIITGIDGYRLVADRTGWYAGNDEPVFEGRVNQPYRDGAFDAPAKASITVWKLVAGHRVPFTASAYWKEYWPGERKGHMWAKMPHVMLAKCAEAQALRKAFPADLSGVYTAEELSQADWYEEVAPSTVTPQDYSQGDDVTVAGKDAEMPGVVVGVDGNLVTVSTEHGTFSVKPERLTLV